MRVQPLLATTLSGHQRPAAPLVLFLANLKYEIRRRAGRLPGEQPAAFDAADLGHRALGTPVLLADPEDDGIDEAEGVIEHQAFDFAVGRATPMAANDEGSADLDFTPFRVMAMVAARTDQPVGRAVDEHKTHFGCERAVEIFRNAGSV